MDAAVSLHHGAALPLPASSSSHHHRSLHHLNPPTSSTKQQQQQPRARLSVTLARASVSSSSSASAAAVPRVVQAQQQQKNRRSISSSRAAMGYAAALADASIRSGTLPRAARHARALLAWDDAGVGVAGEDPRVVVLVRMLVGKGKGGMVADVMAKFVAICDRLLLLPVRARAVAASSS